ncbi:MAG: ATP-binding cassette domain-containing protein [Paracoccaceae bacterium]|nr:ATP-binding cassette domain-containing protein [Paracoccaceae bacterium]
MRTPLLELRAVSQTFRVRQGLMGGHLPLHAVADVSMSIEKGEVVGLVGESGCGKSTLAKILLGLLDPTAGDVLYDGAPLRTITIGERARKIQPIFQDPYSSLNPRKTVGQIVGLPLSIHGGLKGEVRRAALLEMLDMVGLPRRVEHAYPSQLSGGQRQRVAIARALITRPGIVICDEPTSALDVSVQSQILNLLSDLRDELGLTYLLISHNLTVVEHLAERVMVMYLGRIVESGTTDRIFRAPVHPYTQVLLRAALPPVPGYGVPKLDLGADYPNPVRPPSGCTFHPRCPKAFDRCSVERPIPTKRAGDTMAACHLDECR